MTFKKKDTSKQDELDRLIQKQKESTADQRFRDTPPSEFIQEIMKGKSKVEMLDAEVNLKRYVNLVDRIATRLARKEKENKEKIEEELITQPQKEIPDLSTANKLKQHRLF